MAGGIHHVELWVPDLDRSESSWGWLLGELGYTPYQRWNRGRSWRTADGTYGPYIVVEQSDAASAHRHERLRPGVNHLAFWAGSRGDVDTLAGAAPAHGWSLLFADRHPYAGGP